MSNFLNNANKNWSVVAGQIQNQAANGVVYIKESSFQIPTGASNDRPSVGEAGMIRYLTDDNLLEFYNGTSWLPISQQPPSITSISPLSVPDNSGGTIDVSVNIVGDNFGLQPPDVYFIGSDAVQRLASSVTNVVADTQVRAVLPSSVFDASNQEPFAVKLINISSSLSVTTVSPTVIDINTPPYFITNSPLPDISNNSFVNSITLSGELDISAGDIDDNTLTFTSPSPNPISDIQSSALTLNSSSGVITGTLSNPGANTTYNFNVQITDSANNFRVKLYSFSFTMPPISLTFVSGTTLPSPIYVDSGNTIVGGPVVGGFTIYTFTTTSNYVFSCPTTISVVQYLIIAGGGGGGPGFQAGGGGAGGVLQDTSLTLADSTNYTVAVGAGGAGGDNAGVNPSTIKGSNGSDSSLTGGVLPSLTATGGGGGASYNNGNGNGSGLNGGSGGGAGATNTTESGGTGVAGPPRQGYAGGGVSGYAAPYCGGGGGGAGAVGSPGGAANLIGDGGIGITSSITGVTTYYAGGGGGGSYQAGSVSRVANRTGINSGATQPGTGGEYGGGYGAFGSTPITAATAGTANTGGGGGGGALNTTTVGGTGASGGSGIVVIRFPSFA